MKTKEKAIELYNKFLNPSGDTYLYNMLEHESAKECALIAVDEILNYCMREVDAYWQEVKQEIENL